MVLRVIDEPLDLALAQFKPPALLSPLSVEQCCRLAVLMAYQGLGRVSPNPLVGAVVVDKAGRLLGVGAHLRHGGPHAEIEALARLSHEELRGSTIYITLEPCTIDGKTPACAPQLAKIPFAKVVFGAIDPHPKVSGRGAQYIREHCIECVHAADWEIDCLRLAEVFLHDCHHQRPFVALKTASGLDGNIGHQGDRRRWITGPRARQYGHFLRSYYDAILVGRGTVEADDPMLDARDAMVFARHPRRIVLDPTARLANAERRYKVFAPHLDLPTLWFVGSEHAARATHAYPHVEVCPIDASAGAFSHTAILQAVYQRGVRSVLVEGGARTAASWLASGLVDRLHTFQASHICGGTTALNWSALCSPKIDISLSEPEITVLGDDWMISAKTQPAKTKESM